MRAVLITTAILALSACAATPPADQVILNATVITMDPDNPRAQALAIRDGVFVAVGTNEQAKKHIGPDTEVLDYTGKLVTPGLTDSHYHLRGVGEREMTLNLAGINGLNEFLAKVQDYAEANPDNEWITGRGWIETHWDPPVFPTRHQLDQVVPDRPVFLTRADGHAAIANTRALEIAGIDEHTEAPTGGRIEAGGMLIDTAQQLVRRHIPNGGRPDAKEALRIGGEVAQRQGWVGVHNIVDSWEDVEWLRQLYHEDKMPITNYVAIRWPSEGAEHLLRIGPQIDIVPGKLTVRAIKINLDGALGSRGAALLEPYADDPDNVGLIYHTEDALRDVLTRARDAGIQVWTHAIGDRANRMILDLYEEVLTDSNVGAAPSRRDHRWRIEHAQHLTAEDIPRFAELGVIASMQPSHAIGDLHFAPARLGLERLQYAYAWRSLLNAGAIIAGGSDAPVEVGDPCIELHAATTRSDLDGHVAPGWHPKQALALRHAIKMFTQNAAHASFLKRSRSMIRLGTRANKYAISTRH
ncbi:MAG: amidohydrolase [Gammaproteobacteria bacterium]